MEIFDKVLKAYDEEARNLKETLGNGSAEDYPHYRQLVGSIASIEWAKQTLKDVLKQTMEDD
jgi:hypothetical protein|tara:strand:+ start:126 stop:311 length:186 start_codon:yes stop_codon:yes gene_type:complete